MHVALYFGSFDPLHNGHMALVGYTLAYAPVDQVWLVLSPQSPFKTSRTLTDQEVRCAYIERALRHYGNPSVLLCREELELPKPSFTINTLDSLSLKFPDVDFSLLMGADNFQHISEWRGAERLLAKYPIYVYPRHGHRLEIPETPPLPQAARVILLDAPRVEMSATFIREGLMQGHCMDFFLPVPYQL